MHTSIRRALRNCVVLFGLLLCFGFPACAQYTDRQALEDLGGPQEFAQRRAELVKHTKTGITLLFARNQIPEAAHYREDNDFYYFTGLQEPGAVLGIDNSSGDTFLFMPQQATHTAQVYGQNLLSLPAAEAKKLGFERVWPISQLDLLSFVLSAQPEADLWVRLNFPTKLMAPALKPVVTTPGNSHIPITSRSQKIWRPPSFLPNAIPWPSCAT